MNKYDALDLIRSAQDRLEQLHNIKLEFFYSEHGWEDDWPTIAMHAYKEDVGFVTTVLVKSKIRSDSGGIVFDENEVQRALLGLNNPQLWKNIADNHAALAIKNEQELIKQTQAWGARFTLAQVVPQPATTRSALINLTVPNAQTVEYSTLPISAIGPALSVIMPKLLSKWAEHQAQFQLAQLTAEQIGVILMSQVIAELEAKSFENGMERQRNEDRGIRY